MSAPGERSKATLVPTRTRYHVEQNVSSSNGYRDDEANPAATLRGDDPCGAWSSHIVAVRTETLTTVPVWLEQSVEADDP